MKHYKEGVGGGLILLKFNKNSKSVDKIMFAVPCCQGQLYYQILPVSRVGVSLLYDKMVFYICSNSLILYEEKTKQITTVKEVWICDPSYHKIL